MIHFLNSDMAIPIIAGVIVFSYFAGSFMDILLGAAGFGIIGNLLVMVTGSALGKIAYDGVVIAYHQGPVVMVISAIAGAFMMLMLLSAMKAGLARMGY